MTYIDEDYFQQQIPPETLIKTVSQFVHDLPSSDIDAACIEIFGDLNDLRAAKLKQAVQYYLNGTKDGFLKYRTASGKSDLICHHHYKCIRFYLLQHFDPQNVLR